MRLLAPPQYGHPVADGKHFVQFVGDDDDGLAVFPHAPQHGKQPLDLLWGQHGGGLVQYQDIRTAVQYLDDLNGLFFGYGHVIYFFTGIDMKAVFFGYLGHPVVYFLQVVPAFFLDAQYNVFRSGKQVHQLEMLMDHADAVIKCVRCLR